MGYSEKIEDKMKSNEEFRKFMDKIGEEARTEEDRLLAALTARAQTHYEKNKWDYARLFGDKRSDYQNYSDWSLTRINNIIDTIGGALSASDFPSAAVPGSKDASKGTVDTAKGALSAFQGDFILVIASGYCLIGPYRSRVAQRQAKLGAAGFAALWRSTSLFRVHRKRLQTRNVFHQPVHWVIPDCF